MILKLVRNGQVLDQKVIVILGDVNGDGKITVNDAVFASNHYIKLTTLEGAYLKAADANGDNRITTNDAVFISNHYIKLIDLFEEE